MAPRRTARPRPLALHAAAVGLLLFGVSACFDEVKLPNGTEASTGQTTAGPSASETSTGSGTQSTTDDVDPPGTTATSTTGGGLEGLFGCAVPEPCALWEPPACAGDCQPLDEVGACVIGKLKSRGAQERLLIENSGDGTITAYVMRGGAAVQVDVQTAPVDGENIPTDYGPIQRCNLVEETFFDACLGAEAPEPGCTDPSVWASDCQTVEMSLCDFPAP